MGHGVGTEASLMDRTRFLGWLMVWKWNLAIFRFRKFKKHAAHWVSLWSGIAILSRQVSGNSKPCTKRAGQSHLQRQGTVHVDASKRTENGSRCSKMTFFNVSRTCHQNTRR